MRPLLESKVLVPVIVLMVLSLVLGTVLLAHDKADPYARRSDIQSCIDAADAEHKRVEGLKAALTQLTLEVRAQEANFVVCADALNRIETEPALCEAQVPCLSARSRKPQ